MRLTGFQPTVNTLSNRQKRSASSPVQQASVDTVRFSSILHDQRIKVLQDKEYFYTEDYEYYGLDILQLAMEVLHEKDEPSVAETTLLQYLFLDETTSNDRDRIKRGLATGLKELSQADLIGYTYNQFLGQWEIRRKPLGDEYLLQLTGKTFSKYDKPLQTPTRVEPESVLEKLTLQQGAGSVVNAALLEKMDVLTTDYVDQLTGWHVLKLTEELDQKRFPLVRWMAKGVDETTILKQFSLSESKSGVARALRDLTRVGLLDMVQKRSGYGWSVTKDGQETLKQGNPLHTGQLTREMLQELLTSKLTTLRDARSKETLALQQLEEEEQKALEQIESCRDAHDKAMAKALEMMDEADAVTGEKERLRLKQEAVLQALQAEEIQFQMELEETYAAMLEERLGVARERYSKWLEQNEAAIKQLMQAQAQLRFMDLNAGIRLMLSDIERLNTADTIPVVSTLVEHISGEHALSDARKEMEMHVMPAVPSSEYQQDLILKRLRQKARFNPDGEETDYQSRQSSRTSFRTSLNS